MIFFSVFSRGFIVLALILSLSVQAALTGSEHFYTANGQRYRYVVVQSGDNYNFEFDQNPGNMEQKTQAGLHVLFTLYGDSSIDPFSRQQYVRERAKCSAFDSSFYTYSLCFLPNDFTPSKKERFWGFATQIPNWKWLLLRVLLPVVFGFGVVFFVSRKRMIYN